MTPAEAHMLLGIAASFDKVVIDQRLMTNNLLDRRAS